jgi:hypothetical protein
VFSHVAGPIWNDRYESLRAAWLAWSGGWGQGLFLRQGLVAWMQAWPVEHGSPPALLSESGKEIADCQLTDDLQRQVTGELVNIILHQHDSYDQEIAL